MLHFVINFVVFQPLLYRYFRSRYLIAGRVSEGALATAVGGLVRQHFGQWSLKRITPSLQASGFQERNNILIDQQTIPS